jgi:hypothetical protein
VTSTELCRSLSAILPESFPIVSVPVASERNSTRGAIEDFITLAQNKPMTFKSPSARKAMLRDETYAQCTVAQVEAMVSSARGFVFEAFGDVWNTLLTGDLPSLIQRARARLAMVHASTACTQAVELLYKASGGSSVYAGNAFDRRLRDI